jgi:hypothetical protein
MTRVRLRGFEVAFRVGIVFAAHAGLASDYFVAPAGDDQNPGTSPQQAWKSLARANAGPYRPGDRVLLEGGQVFSGNLHWGPAMAGQSGAPLVLSSFGTGRPRLMAGRDTGITIESAGYVTISNLIVLGDGPTNNQGYGVLVDNRLDGFQRLKEIRIENVEASGFGVFGILISGKSAGFDHVRVVDCELHDNLRGGMEIAGRLPWDSPLFAHRAVEVIRCLAHHNSGDPHYEKNHSGSGMVVYEIDGGLIEGCRAWANGQLCQHGNGGVGIWSCASRGVVIQHCESYQNRTHGGDGGGFDLDGGSIDCVLQYNYSHDNDGPGLMAYTYPYASHHDSGCVIRFNVSDNDSRRSRTYAGLWVRSDGSGIKGLRVYNNTIRMGPWSNQAAFVDGKGVEADFRNNVLIGCERALPLVVESPTAGLRFENNLYWAGGAPFSVRWGAQIFADLDHWRQATGQERSAGKALGFFEDPGLRSGDSATKTEAADWLGRLAPYKRRSAGGSPQGILVDAGAPEPSPRRDILGSLLREDRWPMGAVGSSSM